MIDKQGKFELSVFLFSLVASIGFFYAIRTRAETFPWVYKVS